MDKQIKVLKSEFLGASCEQSDFRFSLFDPLSRPADPGQVTVSDHWLRGRLHPVQVTNTVVGLVLLNSWS